VVDGAAAVPVAEPNRPADASPVRAGDTGTSSVAAPPLEPEEQQRATLDAESVRMVVRHHLPQVRACYDRALKQQEGIAGVVEVEFEVTAEGTVASSNVHRNTTGHEGLGLCIAGLLRAWRFPRPVGGQVVFVYPFVFSARE
jgi:TonB family protein